MLLVKIFHAIHPKSFTFSHSVKDFYTDVSDEVLDNIIAEIQRNSPNAGSGSYMVIFELKDSIFRLQGCASRYVELIQWELK